MTATITSAELKVLHENVFYVHMSMHRKSKLIIIQRDATTQNMYSSLQQ
jgi:hypothetical protein